MKCPKCGFISFDYLGSCQKCKIDLSPVRRSLGLLDFDVCPEPSVAARPPDTDGPEDRYLSVSLEDVAFGASPEGIDPGMTLDPLALDEVISLSERGAGQPSKENQLGDAGSGGAHEEWSLPGFLTRGDNDLLAQVERFSLGDLPAGEDLASEGAGILAGWQAEADHSGLPDGTTDTDEDTPEMDVSGLEADADPLAGLGMEPLEEDAASADDISLAELDEDLRLALLNAADLVDELFPEDDDAGGARGSLQPDRGEDGEVPLLLTEEADGPTETKPLELVDAQDRNDASGDLEIDLEIGLDEELRRFLEQEGTSLEELAAEEQQDDDADDDPPSGPGGGGSADDDIRPLRAEDQPGGGDNSPDKTRRASFTLRGLALTVDALVLTTLLAAVVALSATAFAWATRPLDPAGLPALLRLILVLVPVGLPVAAVGLVVTYFTCFHGLSGSTPGKMLLGLRVCDESGERLGCGPAFLRCVGYMVSALPFVLGFLWAAGKRRLAWHDRLAHSQVTGC
ncbi:MAG: RDD family protein [Pseudomonadota bacterium]